MNKPLPTYDQLHTLSNMWKEAWFESSHASPPPDTMPVKFLLLATSLGVDANKAWEYENNQAEYLNDAPNEDIRRLML